MISAAFKVITWLLSYLNFRRAACLRSFSLMCLGLRPLFLPSFLPPSLTVFYHIVFFFEILPGFLPLFFLITISSVIDEMEGRNMLLLNSGIYCYYLGALSLSAVELLITFSIKNFGVIASYCSFNLFCSLFSFKSCLRLISNSFLRNRSSSYCIFLASRSNTNGLFATCWGGIS